MSQDTVFQNARLFSGTDETVTEDGALWVRDGEVAFAGDQARLPDIPPQANVIDAAGAFIMPGMTETHAHLSFADASPFAIGATPVETATITAVRNAELMLSAGFT